MNEQQELEHYEEGMKWLDEAKEDFDKWFTRMQGEVQTDQQRRVRVLVNSDLDPFSPIIHMHILLTVLCIFLLVPSFE